MHSFQASQHLHTYVTTSTRCKQLQDLALQCSNKLETLPSLEGLHSLKALHLKYNGFTQLPPQLATLPHLELLDLSGNQIRVLDDVLLLGLPKLRCMFGDAWCE